MDLGVGWGSGWMGAEWVITSCAAACRLPFAAFLRTVRCPSKATTTDTSPPSAPHLPPPQTSEVQKQVKAVQAAFQHGKGKKNETTPEDGKLTLDTMKVGAWVVVVGGWAVWRGA